MENELTVDSGRVRGLLSGLKKELRKTKQEIEYFHYNNLVFYLNFHYHWDTLVSSVQKRTEGLTRVLVQVPGLKQAADGAKREVLGFQCFLSEFTAKLNQRVRGKQENLQNEVNSLLNEVLWAFTAGEKPSKRALVPGIDYKLLDKIHESIKGLTELSAKLTKKTQEQKAQLERQQREINYLQLIAKTKEKLHRNITRSLRASHRDIRESLVKGFAELTSALQTLPNTLYPQKPSVKTQLLSLKASLPSLAALTASQLSCFSSDLCSLQSALQSLFAKDSVLYGDSFNSLEHISSFGPHSEIAPHKKLLREELKLQLQNIRKGLKNIRLDLLDFNMDASHLHRGRKLIVIERGTEECVELSPGTLQQLLTNNRAQTLREFTDQLEHLKQDAGTIKSRARVLEYRVKTEFLEIAELMQRALCGVGYGQENHLVGSPLTDPLGAFS